jgi:hypothetical protein
MKTKADKVEQSSARGASRRHAVHRGGPRHRSVGETAIGLLDNRPSSAVQRKLQQSIDRSPRQLAQADVLSQLTGSPLQRQGAEEEELLQGKFEPVQRQGPEEEELLQGRFETPAMPTQSEVAEEDSENRTGMPGRLKAGLERLSGMDLSDVRVHGNSPKPAQLDAFAYAQGSDIHLGPGQEQHLPHEAWHIVQQRQGRVRATMKTKGVFVNDDEGLEQEADVMGEKAMHTRSEETRARVSVVPVGVGRDRAATIQAKWITRIGKTVWVPDSYDLKEGEAPVQSPEGASLEGLPINAMSRIVDYLPVKDVGSAASVSKGLRSKLQETGRAFMNPLYHNPEETVPKLLPSVEAWAKGEGPPAEPKAKSELVYKMAGLDPQTKLDTGLGKQSKSTGGKKFLQGGGFFAHEMKVGETAEEAEEKYQASLRTYEDRKSKGLRVGPNRPTKKEPIAPTQTGYVPTETGYEQSGYGPDKTGYGVEYHPGGGVHSNYEVETTGAMGGSYLKVEKPGKKSENPSYRFARYGPFESGEKTGYFWDPLKPPKDPVDRELGALSAKELVKEGASKEIEGNTEEAKKYTQEARNRLEEQPPPDNL